MREIRALKKVKKLTILFGRLNLEFTFYTALSFLFVVLGQFRLCFGHWLFFFLFAFWGYTLRVMRLFTDL